MIPATEHRKLAAIMFTDMVGCSALSQRHEALALELLEEHRRIFRDILPRHGGREVKTTGDGFLIEFPSAPWPRCSARWTCRRRCTSGICR